MIDGGTKKPLDIHPATFTFRIDFSTNDSGIAIFSGMSGPSRTLDTLGAIASIVGFVASICMIALTDYKVAALVSLLIAETVIVAVWWHYVRRRNACVHPFEREEVFQYVRYVFDTPTKMSYEVTEVSRIMQPVVTAIPVKLTWSGRGTVSVRSHLIQGEIPFTSDGQTGELSFSFPLSEPRRFGETVLIQYTLELEDTSQQNVPKLSKTVRRPCQFFILEAVLRHRSVCQPAQLVWVPLDNPSHLRPASKIADVPFDTFTHSYRISLPCPIVGRSYQLHWNPNNVAESE